MSKIYRGIIKLIGNTPLVETINIEKSRNLEATVLVKLEYFNPAGSIKELIINGSEILIVANMNYIRMEYNRCGENCESWYHVYQVAEEFAEVIQSDSVITAENSCNVVVENSSIAALNRYIFIGIIPLSIPLPQ